MESYQASFWPQQYESRIQLQNESWNCHKYVKIKQHASEQLLGQWKPKKKKKKLKDT